MGRFQSNCKVMPKVQPKEVKKVSPKADAKVDAKAKAEKEKAERQSLIESLVEGVASVISEYENAAQSAKQAFFAIADSVKEAVDENELTAQEARALVIAALAEAYSIDGDTIKAGASGKAGTLYTNLSKIMALVFPPGNKKLGVSPEKAAKELAKAREKGITVETALNVARGKIVASGAPRSGGKGKTADGQKAPAKKVDVIEDEESLKTAFAAVISKARKGGMDLESIQSAFAEQLAEYEEQEEETED